MPARRSRSRGDRRPFIRFFERDYTDDTANLTDAEHGCYLALIITAWRQPDCELPCDDRELCRMLRAIVSNMSHQRYHAVVRPLLDHYWPINPATGKYANKRLKQEWNNAQLRSSEATRSALIRHHGAQSLPPSLPRDFLGSTYGATADLRAKQPQQPASNSNGLGDANAHATAHADGHATHRVQNIRESCSVEGVSENPEPLVTRERMAQDLAKLGLTVQRRNHDATLPPFAHRPEMPPDERLTRFQQWLAPRVPGAWLTIAAALDPNHQDHNTAIRACKTAAKVHGKGWPIAWPE